MHPEEHKADKTTLPPYVIDHARKIMRLLLEADYFKVILEKPVKGAFYRLLSTGDARHIAGNIQSAHQTYLQANERRITCFIKATA